MKEKAESTFNEFNNLKGGGPKVIKEADSNFQNFQYGVFKREFFENQYEGISKLVRNKMNDPNYFNNRLHSIGDQIRENIQKHESKKQEVRERRINDGLEGTPKPEQAEFDENVEQIEKSMAYHGYIGKPPKYQSQQPVYSFQKKYMPIKTRVQINDKKTKSF